MGKLLLVVVHEDPAAAARCAREVLRGCDHEPLVGPRRDLHDVLVHGVGEAMELQRTALVAQIHTIERERSEVNVQAQRRVATLHEGDRTDLQATQRAQPQRSFWLAVAASDASRR